MGQLILSKGLAKAEVCVLVQRAITPTKRASLYLLNHHTCIRYCIRVCFTYRVPQCTVFSPLQVKNKSHDGDSEHEFIPGSQGFTVANKNLEGSSRIQGKFFFSVQHSLSSVMLISFSDKFVLVKQSL
jgi:hypothetical protein